MKKLIYTLALGALVVGLGTALPAAAGDPSEDCATCHEDIAANFAHTVHAAKDRGGPTCATCHGNGDRHMEESGDPTLIGKPEGQDLEILCLTCHRDTQTMFSSRSVHSGAQVTCVSCHNIHTADPLQPEMLQEDCQPALRQLPLVSRRVVQPALRPPARPRRHAVRLMPQPARRRR